MRWQPIGAALLLTVTAACSGSGGTSGSDTTAVMTSVAVTTSVAGASSAADTTEAATSAVATVAARPPKTLHVPGDAATVQGALDQTVPGDLVLIAPGTYHEAVTVRTPGIVVRGASRAGVVLDGSDTLENGVLVAADGVAVENLTVRHFAVNGVLFTKAYEDTDPTQHTVLHGYRASYITAYDDGLYGVYAFFAEGGQIDHSYASGHPDSGFYIGQCKPCDAVLTDSVAEHNAVGYEGTNSSGNLSIVNSVWRADRVGLTPNSQDQERLAPQGDVVIAGNLVEGNGDPTAPATAQGANGFGIAIGGGNHNTIVRNLVRNNTSVGVSISDLNSYKPSGNEVRDNVLQGNGTDLAYFLTGSTGALPTAANCFAGNTFTTSSPDKIEQVMPCPGTQAQVTASALSLQPAAPNVDYRTVPAPPDQPEMPDAATAPAQAATGLKPTVDVTTITVPAAS